jgi:Zn-dependent protease with chaperone function
MKYLGALIAFPLAMLLVVGMNWVALLRFSSEAAHWTARARKLYPIRRSAALNVWLIPALFGLAHLLATRGTQPLVAGAWTVFAWAGAILGTYSFDKRTFPRFTFKIWLRSVYSTWLMRFGVLGTLVLGAIIMPEDFGWPLIFIGCVVIAFQAALHFGFWIWLGKTTGSLVQASDSDPLSGIVRRTAEQMHVRYRKIWMMRSPVGYAAAFPTTGDLIFSEGLAAEHPEEEIAAICAHELAHLTEPRRAVYARVLGAMSWCPLIFIRPMVHAFDFVGIAVLIVPMAFASVFVGRLGRKMEVRADAVANQNAAEVGVYARALERLYRNNQIPAVMPGKRQLHPHLYDRLLAAGVTPDYPRPEAPDKLHWVTGFMYLVLVVLFSVLMSTN